MMKLISSAAGIVLCGGRSTRMGRDKASLAIGGETMLARVVRLLSDVVCPVVVVGAQGQSLPALPANLPVEIAADHRSNRGPLEGLKAGLSLLQGRSEIEFAFVTSCDAPLVVPAFVRQLFSLLGDDEIVVPKNGAFYHPLSAIYRTSILPQVERLLEQDRLRMNALFETCPTRSVPVEDLRAADPELCSLLNLNRPEDLAEVERRLN